MVVVSEMDIMSFGIVVVIVGIDFLVVFLEVDCEICLFDFCLIGYGVVCLIMD